METRTLLQDKTQLEIHTLTRCFSAERRETTTMHRSIAFFILRLKDDILFIPTSCILMCPFTRTAVHLLCYSLSDFLKNV